MKRNLYIIMVCCAAALVSCKKNEVDNPNPGTDPEPQPEGKAVLYGSLSEATKTYLSPTAETSDSATFKVLWEKDDAIAIIRGGKKTAEYDTQGQGVVKAKFEFKVTDPAGTELEKEDEFEAIYPAGLVKSGIGDALSLVWPAEQEYKVISGSKHGEAGNNPMWATAKVAKEDEGVTEMRFYNLGGVVRFKLSQPAEDFNVVMATISADQPLSGAFDLKEITIIEDGESKSIRKAEINSNGSEDIFIKPTAPVSISTSGEASFYFAVPEGIYTGVEITLYGANGKNIRAKLAADKSLEVKRSEVVRLKATDVATSAIIEGSNCFIGEGNVPIVITAMGNAFDGTTALDGNDTKAVWKAIGTNANGCKIVWETENTATAPADNTIIKSATFANGILTVIPTGTPGNALVAITDGANGTGNIVWSYHIWVPETPLNIVSINNSNGNFIFLDRNIGALCAADPSVTDNTKSIGMLYQWGRKDPLLGYCDFNYDTLMNGGETISSIDQQSSLSSAIQNPTKFIKGGSDGKGFWLNYQTLCNLWGTKYNGDRHTLSDDTEKTIYDPCPQGYRVVSSYKLFKAFNLKDTYSGTIPNFGNTTSIVNNTWSVSGLNFPQIASINVSGTKQTTYGDSYIQVWSSTGRGAETDTAWYLTLKSNTIYRIGRDSNGWYKACAANVRCIKDQSSTDGYSFNVIAHEDINFFD